MRRQRSWPPGIAFKAKRQIRLISANLPGTFALRLISCTNGRRFCIKVTANLVR
jgi:hypothetical protein